MRLLLLSLALLVSSTASSGALDPPDPLELTDEMKQWAQERVPRSLPAPTRGLRLIEALNGLALSYQVGQTGTAIDVFEGRTFNCVSFSFLFVGLARHLGLPAYFYRALNDQGYSREGALMVVTEHMTAGIQEGIQELMLDFRFLPDPTSVRFRRLTDEEAYALYYSNVGAERLFAGQPDEALPWLDQAVETEPGMSELWVNLGVARRHAGDPEGAEAAYRRALEADPDNPRAYINLAALFWRLGREDAAEQLLDLLDRGNHRDPHVCLVLGDRALGEGRYEDAERFYRKAVRRDRLSADPRAALGLLALRQGELARARRHLRGAQRRGPESPRTIRLESALSQRGG